MKKGFTLSEMVITLGLVGVISVILLPVLRDVIPNQEMVMFKKAYSISERIVAELVNDDILYPEKINENEESGDVSTQYFANTEEVISKGKSYSGDTKFCELFASKLNRSSDVECSADKAFVDGEMPSGTVVTSDGVVWILPVTTFPNLNDAQEIKLDVNGNKKPNCVYSATTCKKPDRFAIKIYQDGKMEVDGVMEKEYLYRSDFTKNAEAETFNEDEE